MSENPYREQAEEYRKRAKTRDYFSSSTFFLDKNWSEGKEKGWDEGYAAGTDRYFDLNCQNDCADALFTYLSRLEKLVGEKFGEESEMRHLLWHLLLNLQEAPIPADVPYEPMSSLYLIDDEEIADTGEEEYEDGKFGVILQPFEY